MNHESHILYAKTASTSWIIGEIIYYYLLRTFQVTKKNEIASRKEIIFQLLYNIRLVAMYRLHCRKCIMYTFIKVLSFPLNCSAYFLFGFRFVRSIYYDSWSSIVSIMWIIMHNALFTLKTASIMLFLLIHIILERLRDIIRIGICKYICCVVCPCTRLGMRPRSVFRSNVLNIVEHKFAQKTSRIFPYLYVIYSLDNPCCTLYNDNSFGIPELICVNSKYHRPVPAILTTTDAVISSPEFFHSVPY